MRSTTKTSTGTGLRSSLSPSCDCSAAKISGSGSNPSGRLGGRMEGLSARGRTPSRQAVTGDLFFPDMVLQAESLRDQVAQHFLELSLGGVWRHRGLYRDHLRIEPTRAIDLEIRIPGPQ